MKEIDLDKAGTFVLNKGEPVHRWYSYVEGYSSCLIVRELSELKSKNIKTIYDPFGGTGTTALVASSMGIKPYYSESNPFMQMVINTKINDVLELSSNNIGTKYLEMFLDSLSECTLDTQTHIEAWDGFEKFFEPSKLSQLLHLKELINEVKDETTKRILMIALSSITVSVSKMTRRGDLRYAKPNEIKPIDVKESFITKLTYVISDINEYENKLYHPVTMISEDARNNNTCNLIDCVITSPPYLNGTNYIRNTKLELKLCDYIKSEKDMASFHSKGIIAGINNVSKRNGNIETLTEVQPYIDILTPVAYDKRIPLMVAGYFYDMNTVIEKLKYSMNNNGYFIMDIGDSQFAGVHIPTHEILSELCEKHGFHKYAEEILRERRSKNGMILSQRLLKFKLKKN